MCKAYGNTCSKCHKKNHYPSVCQSRKPKVSAVATSDSEIQQKPVQNNHSAEVSHLSSFFAMTAFTNPSELLNQLQSEMPPTSAQDLHAAVNTLREAKIGPVTSLPLPHHVHDVINGWKQARPRASPTLSVVFALERRAYSELALALPRLSTGSHPGRSGPTPSVCDTGAQLTVIPRSLLASMHVKMDSIFPIQTSIHGVANSPLSVDGGILLAITARQPDTGAT